LHSLREEGLKSRIAPKRVKSQRVDAEVGGSCQQPLDFIEGAFNAAGLSKDLSANVCHPYSHYGVPTVNPRLLQPTSLAERLIPDGPARPV
jgi:hypothetical protein